MVLDLKRGDMMKKILLILMLISSSVLAETPPLQFISIDCTQYGSIETPYLILSGIDKAMKGPIESLPDSEDAIELLHNILEAPHEEWMDPACNGEEVEYQFDVVY